MAKEALQLFRVKLLKDLPADEIGKIALHFINAQGETVDHTREEYDISKQIMAKVEQTLHANGIKRTKTNSNFYDRFMIHLSYFLNYLDRPTKAEASISSLEQHIKSHDPKAYQIGSEIFDVIKELVIVPVNESERFYIILHIQRLL